MSAFFSIHWFLIAGIWYGVNGILHDVFILKAHKGSYDRDLLRLLMDGHVLILSGIVMVVCWYMCKVAPGYAAITAFVIALGMIVYCAMIFPFLKSFVTLGMSLILVCVSVRLLLH